MENKKKIHILFYKPVPLTSSDKITKMLLVNERCHLDVTSCQQIGIHPIPTLQLCCQLIESDVNAIYVPDHKLQQAQS